jgi:hypothetical protein
MPLHENPFPNAYKHVDNGSSRRSWDRCCLVVKRGKAPMEKRSDAENEGCRGRRSCAWRSPLCERGFRHGQGVVRCMNSRDCNWWRTHARSSLSSGSAGLPTEGIMRAAVVLGDPLELYLRRGASGLLTLLGGAVMARCRSRRSRIAQDPAHRPPNWQSSQDGQHDDTDRSLCQAHGSSIPRPRFGQIADG